MEMERKRRHDYGLVDSGEDTETYEILYQDIENSEAYPENPESETIENSEIAQTDENDQFQFVDEEEELTPFFHKTDLLLYHKFGNMVIFRSGNL